MPAFQLSRYSVVQLDMVHFSDSKIVTTNFTAFTHLRLNVQWAPPKREWSNLFTAVVDYELQYDLAYHFIKKKIYAAFFFPDYIQNNLPERWTS